MRNQLGGISGMLYISSHGSDGDRPLSDDESNRLFSEQSKGDPEVFSRKLLEATLILNGQNVGFDLFYKPKYAPGTQINSSSFLSV